MKLSAGDIFDGKYEIIKVLGAGGFGLVYQAKDNELNRIVAIKIYSPFGALVDSKEQIIRFKREAQVLSKISHVNVVKIFRYGLLEDDIPFLVLEFIEGESLDKILAREKTLSWRQSTKIILEVCKGLEAIHELGILHRDLKPQNIIVAGNMHSPLVKIIDFGLCKFQNSEFKSSNTLTNTGFVVGTVQYLSPEQCASKKADARADVYSLGIMLYEMLVGEVPFSGQAFEQVFKHINTPMPRLSESVRDVKFPKQLDEIILKCCAKLPNSRYKSVDDLAKDLALVLLEDGDARRNPDLIKLESDKNSLHIVSKNFYQKIVSREFLFSISMSLLILATISFIFFPILLFSFVAKNIIKSNAQANMQELAAMELRLIDYCSEDNAALILDNLFSSFEFRSKTDSERFEFQYYLFKEFCKNKNGSNKIKSKLAIALLEYFFKIENTDHRVLKKKFSENDKKILLDLTNYFCSLKSNSNSLWRSLYVSLVRSRITTRYWGDEITACAFRLLIACMDNLPELYREDPEAYINACLYVIRISAEKESTLFHEKKEFMNCVSASEVERYAKLAFCKVKECKYKNSMMLELHIFYGIYLIVVKKMPAEAFQEYRKAKNLVSKIGNISEFQSEYLKSLADHLAGRKSLNSN